MNTAHVILAGMLGTAGRPSAVLAQAAPAPQPQAASPTAPVAAMAVAVPNDAEIIGILLATSRVEIDTGKYATQHGSHGELKNFAKKMVTEHATLQKGVHDLAAKHKVAAVASETSKGIETSGEETLTTLKKLKGLEFDRAYAEREAAFHQQALDTLNKALLVHVQDAELKSWLEKMTVGVQAHLARAKTLQASLGPSK